MIEILEFTFQDFWHFAGMIIILGIVCEGLAGIGISFGGWRK